MEGAESKAWIKWVAIGCAGLIVVASLAAFAFVSLVTSSVKQSDAFAGAMKKARDHRAVVAALGEPIDPGFFVSGSVAVEGPSGRAELSVPISGPRGEGTLFVEATKRAGRWEFALLELEVEGREERIDLLAAD